VFAWDTETFDIDPKIESPVGKGKILCATAFGGPEINFGSGPRLFIDNYAQNEDLILFFKEYFEDNACKKVWHNYGYDRHIINNHKIDIKGFHGDTMHMARLVNPARGPKAYSLSRYLSI
jgi:DNA polymerase I